MGRSVVKGVGTLSRGCGFGIYASLLAGELGHGVRAGYGKHKDECCKGPSGLLKEGVGTTYTQYLVAGAELRRQTTALGLLNEHDTDKQNCYDYYENYKYYMHCILVVIVF